MAVSSAVRSQATVRAFDGVAAAYHRSNIENPILEHMRRRVMRALTAHARAGAEVVDLGCGPGTDHPALVAAGYRVTAIDASPEMTRVAALRAATTGMADHVTVQQLPLEQVASLGTCRFDAALSNFGPLNCVGDLPDVANQIHALIRPGGVLVASVIGRACPWEVALYLLRGDVRRATVRWAGEAVAVPLEGGTVWMQYIAPRAFTRMFRAAGFRCRHLEGLGVVAPPPYLAGSAARRPRLLARLLGVDEAVGTWPVVRLLGDHFLIVLERM